MQTSARYVTQASVYSNQFLGPLTDRKIAKYQKEGYYGSQGKLAQVKQKAKKKSKALTGRKKLEALFAQF